MGLYYQFFVFSFLDLSISLINIDVCYQKILVKLRCQLASLVVRLLPGEGSFL